VQHFLERFQRERHLGPERRISDRGVNARTDVSDDHGVLASERGARAPSERAATPGDRSARFLAERTPLTVSQEGMRRLMAYPWPGNVRQLENAVERAVAFSAGRSQIDVGDLPLEIQQVQEAALTSTITLPEDGVDLDAFVANVERELIQRSLERTGGNKGQAAKLLNLKRTTLVEKLKRLQKRL
jgi:DNA-binding protein Fis